MIFLEGVRYPAPSAPSAPSDPSSPVRLVRCPASSAPSAVQSRPPRPPRPLSSPVSPVRYSAPSAVRPRPPRPASSAPSSPVRCAAPSVVQPRPLSTPVQPSSPSNHPPDLPHLSPFIALVTLAAFIPTALRSTLAVLKSESTSHLRRLSSPPSPPSSLSPSPSQYFH